MTIKNRDFAQITYFGFNILRKVVENKQNVCYT